MMIAVYSFVTVMMFGRVTSFCDDSRTANVREGNIGQIEVFSWLGVLRVHMSEGDRPQVALTGIVLIKKEYALVNADDIVKLPQSVLRQHSSAMFIGTNDKPWFVKPKSVEVHPEYQYSTFNTIAILELDINVASNYPVRPICWPNVGRLNTSTHLYVTGFTDDHLLLEKIIYKVKYMDNSICSEFYERAGLGDPFRKPTHYICGHAPFNKVECLWDNGMILVSNASQYFTLIGFGIRGPGCKAPARFIDLRQYYQWMDDITNPLKLVRRSGGFEDVPVHKLFRYGSNDTFEALKASLNVQRDWPFEESEDKPTLFNVEEIDNHSVAIFPFKNTLELYNQACDSKTSVVYSETFSLSSKFGIDSGVVYYKISLLDLLLHNCTCVLITTSSPTNSKTTFAYKEFLNIQGEVKPLETPQQILELYPFKTLRQSYYKGTTNFFWFRSLEDQTNIKELASYELYVEFPFEGKAVMKIQMFANKKEDLQQGHEDFNALEYGLHLPSKDPIKQKSLVDTKEETEEIKEFERYPLQYDDTFGGKYPLYRPQRKMWNGSFKPKPGIVDPVPNIIRKMFTSKGKVPALRINDIKVVTNDPFGDVNPRIALKKTWKVRRFEPNESGSYTRRTIKPMEHKFPVFSTANNRAEGVFSKSKFLVVSNRACASSLFLIIYLGVSFG